MSQTNLSKIEPGSDTWHRLREKALTDLWWLNEMLGHDKIPMVPRTHLSMIQFANNSTGIPEVDNCRVQRILVPREYGKALALDTPIPTPEGWMPQGDIEVGDKVFGIDGIPIRVTHVFPVEYGRPCYEVCFDDGTSIVADENHEWITYSTYSENTKCRTTKDISDTLLRNIRHEEKAHQIYNGNPLVTDCADLPIDPYVLGCWLGDGHSANGGITCFDQEILGHIEECGVGIKRWESAPGLYGLDIYQDLKSLDLVNNKHIPDVYLRTCWHHRMELLRGLLDTDGSISKRHQIEFTNTNSRIAYGTLELLRTLGFKARILIGRATLYGKDCGPKYRVFTRIFDNTPAFYVKRKLERQLPRPKNSPVFKRIITDVKPVTSVPVRCIEVGAEDGLYLAGEGMVPTHNSKCITLTRTLRNILRNPNHCAGIANESTSMAKGFLGEIKQVFEQNELLQLLFPEIIPSEGERHDMRWAAEQIDVKRDVVRKEPTVLAAGVDKTVTGVHMAEWVLDDIMSNEAAENARAGSRTEIEKIKRWMNRLEPLCDGPGTPITLIGTPWWEGDCYDHAEDLWGEAEEPVDYEWTLNLPDGKKQYHTLTVQGELATFRLPLIVDGKITFPEKWPEHRWLKIQRNDPELFAANFMLDPASEAVRDFKDEWLRYYEWTVPDRQLKYRDRSGELVYAELHEFDCVISVDPAISESVKADYSGIIVSGSLNGTEHIILEAVAERLGVLDLIKKIEKLNRIYKPRRIYVETVAYQKALAQLLQQKRLPIIEAKPGTSKTKEMRIRGLEPFFRQGHVYIHASQSALIREYRRFPRSAHDDLLDAMAYLTKEWSRIIGREKSQDEKRRKHDAEEIRKLKDWAAGARGTRPDRVPDRPVAIDRWTK